MPDTPRKWHQFPEALYIVWFHNVGEDRRVRGTTKTLYIDAVSFTDVEYFFFTNLPAGWEIASIQKTYSYAKMYAGDNGTKISFSFGADLNQIDTINPADDQENMDWPEILAYQIEKP